MADLAKVIHEIIPEAAIEEMKTKGFSSKKRFTWSTENPEELKLDEIIQLSDELGVDVSTIITQYGAGKKHFTERELNFLT